MNAFQLVKHVEDAITRAKQYEHYCDPSVFDLKGFSTKTQRCLVSLLCHGLDSYLEVGLYCGATFCAAASNNATTKMTGFEDWSQPFGEPNVDKEFFENCPQHFDGNNCQLIFEDFFVEPRPDLLFAPFDFLYYDGLHDQAAQQKALPHALPWMGREFLFMVDDYAWESVREGTRAGFESMAGQVEIEKEWVLSDGVHDGPVWHNDVAIFVIRQI